MAGLYPDAPAPRMAWDRDGSKLLLVTTASAVQEETPASRQAANDEANTAATQRLLFWHPTLNQPLSDFPAYFDWGNRPRSSVATRDVRVKNTSDILTASTTVVGVEALTDASPTFVGQHTVSLSGGGFGASVVIPTLAPGQVSPVLTVKQDLLASAALGPWSQRLYAEVGVWT
jgi:hypothetical protein